MPVAASLRCFQSTSGLHRLTLCIPVQPLNSTVQCIFIANFTSRVLVFSMVQQVPAQFPCVVPRLFRLAVHPANHRFFTPLFSASSELLFSQLFCFQNHLRCPLLFSSVRSVSTASVRSCLISFFKSFGMRRLRPRKLSRLSFSRSSPLFSKACGLSCQNAGGRASLPKRCALRAPASFSCSVQAALSSGSRSAQRGRLPHIQLSLLQAQGSQVHG